MQLGVTTVNSSLGSNRDGSRSNSCSSTHLTPQYLKLLSHLCSTQVSQPLPNAVWMTQFAAYVLLVPYANHCFVNHFELRAWTEKAATGGLRYNKPLSVGAVSLLQLFLERQLQQVNERLT